MTHTTTPDTSPDAHDEFEPASPDRLQAHYRRQLSAMLDGELSADECKFMQRRLEHDAALAACADRWRACGDVLRGQPVALLPTDFAERVLAGLRAQDLAPAVPGRPRARGWVGRLALAASVAVVGLFVGRQMPVGNQADTGTPSASVAMEGSSGGPGAGQGVGEASSTVATEVTLGDAGDASAAIAPSIAVATLPAAAARSRGQGQRAARRARAATADRALASAAATPLLMAVGGDISAGQDPFLAPSIAPARPWPRAVLPAMEAGGRFVAGYTEPNMQWPVPAREAPPLPQPEGDGAVAPEAGAGPVADVD